MRKKEVIVKQLNKDYPKFLKLIAKNDIKKLQWFFDLLEELKLCMTK